MSRRAPRAKRGPSSSCEVCKEPLKPDEAHGLCESFALFKQNLKPQFAGVISIQPATQLAPLMTQFDACDNIEDLLELLNVLQNASKILREETADGRMRHLIQSCERYSVISEYTAFEEFRESLRNRFIPLLRGMRQKPLETQYDQVPNGHQLLELLKDVAFKIDGNRFSQSVAHSQRLIAEVMRYNALHGSGGPPPPPTKSRPIGSVVRITDVRRSSSSSPQLKVAGK